MHSRRDGSLTQALLPLTLVAVLLPHGTQHLLGMFGGYGFSGTLGWMTAWLGIPAPIGAAGIVLEFVPPQAILDGIEVGTEEIYPDPMSLAMGTTLQSSPKELERQVASSMAA